MNKFILSQLILSYKSTPIFDLQKLSEIKIKASAYENICFSLMAVKV